MHQHCIIHTYDGYTGQKGKHIHAQWKRQLEPLAHRRKQERVRARDPLWT